MQLLQEEYCKGKCCESLGTVENLQDPRVDLVNFHWCVLVETQLFVEIWTNWNLEFFFGVVPEESQLFHRAQLGDTNPHEHLSKSLSFQASPLEIVCQYQT
jgi:hypothetical protein